MNLFPRNFDLERQKVEARFVQPPVLEESFSRAELEARLTEARRLAYDAGHAAGLEAGIARTRAGLEASASEAASGILARLREMHLGQTEHRAAVERDLLAFLGNAADTLIPEIAAALGPKLLETEIRALAARVIGSERIHIRVAPANLPLLKRLIDQAVAENGGEAGARFTLSADPKLDGSAVSARWQSGGSDHSFEKICAAIRSLLSSTAACRSIKSSPAVFRRKARRAADQAPDQAPHRMTGTHNG